MAKGNPKEALELIYARNDRESATSLSKFLDCVIIDSRPEPRPFGKIAEQWQRDRNEWVIPAFEYVAGIRKEYDGPKNLWLGLSKGHDKSSYIGRILNWMLAYATRPLRCYCCAKDNEQANIIWDAAKREADLNGWLLKHLEFSRNRIVGVDTGARVEILTSDAGGAHGKTPDVLILDEISHWSERDLFDAMWSSKIKRGGYCVSMILTNAGFIGSWQDDIRKIAREQNGKDWFFYEQPVGVQLASWMSEKEIAQERKLISEWEARRLFSNEWINMEEAGMRFLSHEDILGCIGYPQPPPAKAKVVLCIDYGGVCDLTACGVIWYDGTKVHIVKLDCFQGSPQNEIQIADVETWIYKQIKLYPNCVIVFDKYQMLGTLQKLDREGKNTSRFEYRGGKQNAIMAKTLKNFIQNRKLVFTETCGLRNGETFVSELQKLVIKEMSYGEKFDHTTNGYDDRATAIGMGILEVIGYPALPPIPRVHVPQVKLPIQKTLHKPFKSPFKFNNITDRNIYGLK